MGRRNSEQERLTARWQERSCNYKHIHRLVWERKKAVQDARDWQWSWARVAPSWRY
jgi:hypothetical protein